MNRISHRGMTVLKGVSVTACLIAGGLWPDWRDSLQAPPWNSYIDCGQESNDVCAIGYGVNIDGPLSVTTTSSSCVRACHGSEDCRLDEMCVSFDANISGGDGCVPIFGSGVTTGGPVGGGPVEE